MHCGRCIPLGTGLKLAGLLLLVFPHQRHVIVMEPDAHYPAATQPVRQSLHPTCIQKQNEKANIHTYIVNMHRVTLFTLLFYDCLPVKLSISISFIFTLIVSFTLIFAITFHFFFSLPVKHTVIIFLFLHCRLLFSLSKTLTQTTNPFFLSHSEWTCRGILSELCLVFTSLGLGAWKGVGTMGLKVKHEAAFGCPNAVC